MAKSSVNILRKMTKGLKRTVFRVSNNRGCLKTIQDILSPIFIMPTAYMFKFMIEKSRLSLTTLLLSVLQIGVFAQQSTLTLKDGSVMKGYIAAQRPGQYVTFRTTDADVYIDNSEELKIEEKFVPYASLPGGWQEKVSSQGRTGLKLCTISDSFSSHPMAKIIEQGTTIRYEQHCEDVYRLYWSDIQKISRDDTNLSSKNLYDQITLDDGTSFVGIVVEQRPGISTKIKLRNGDVRVIEQSSIYSSKKIAKSVDVDLWESRNYTNTIVLDDGSEHKGIIVNQQIGADAYDSYVELYKSDGTQERINFIDIEEYRNEPCQLFGEAE